MNNLVLTMCLLATAPAFAVGAIIDPSLVPTEARTRLKLEIEAAKRANPEAFVALARTRAAVKEQDARKRGRVAPVIQLFRALGPEALLPMLEVAMFDGPRGDLPAPAWLTWRASLVESIGRLRDARAVPFLEAALAAPIDDFYVVRAVAGAYGFWGSDDAAKRLVDVAAQPGAKQRAVLAGMGSCRRAVCVNALAMHLSTASEPELALVIMNSLGDAGSSWAWQTAAVEAKTEEAAVRATAARALVSAFVRYGGHVRQKASNNLMRVDAPATPQLIAQVRRDASPELRAELDGLAERYARNPAR